MEMGRKLAEIHGAVSQKLAKIQQNPRNSPESTKELRYPGDIPKKITASFLHCSTSGNSGSPLGPSPRAMAKVTQEEPCRGQRSTWCDCAIMRKDRYCWILTIYIQGHDRYIYIYTIYIYIYIHQYLYDINIKQYNGYIYMKHDINPTIQDQSI